MNEPQSPEQKLIRLEGVSVAKALSGSSSVKDENLARHLNRYILAGLFLGRGNRILDCACGSGYGAKYLAMQDNEVLGVDLNPDAINFAIKYNHTANTIYKIADISDLSHRENHFDAVVSFETFEHLPNALGESFLKRCANWISPGGLMCVSSPMLRFRDGRPYVTNPFHINELPRQDLISTWTSIFDGWKTHFYWQNGTRIEPLGDQETGFLLAFFKKPEAQS